MDTHVVKETGKVARSLERKGTFLKILYRQRYLFLMLFPFLIWTAIFQYAPLYGWYMAFVDYRPGIPLFKSKWVGLKHFYRFLFQSGEFLRVMRNTICVNIIYLIISMPLQIALAIVIYELKRFTVFKRVAQTISYLPHFISWVIVGGIFFTFFSMEGVVNNLLQLLNITDEPILFLAEEELAWPILVFTRLWKELGWSTIVYLGAMGGIDPNLYEAAYVDGAGRWKRILHVTLPGLVPTIAVLLILSAGNLINGSFEQVYIFQNPANREYCDTIDTMVYRVGLGQAQFSFATAVGIFNTVCSFTFLLIVNSIVKRLTGKSIF